MEKQTYLSIVFPNLNGDYEELKTLLISVKNSNYPTDKREVIMVDNGSTNDSVYFVRKNFPWVKVIKLSTNYGFSKAVNIGIRKSKGKYIFVTNDDVKLEKNCLKNLVEFAICDSNIGVLGCRVYDFKRPKKVMNGPLSYNFYTGRFTILSQTNKTCGTDWVAGSGIFFPKDIWQKIGGYDEGFFFSSEEVDLCLRVKYAGYKVIYYPKAIYWHGGSTTIHRPEYIDFFIDQINRAKIRLILKHGRFLEILTAIFLQLFLFVPYKSLILREKSFIPFVKALFWNLGNMPKNIAYMRN